MMNCGQIKNLIIECDGNFTKLQLEKASLDEISSHVNSCPGCSKVLSRVLALNKLVLDDKVPAVPAALSSKIMTRIAAEPNKVNCKKIAVSVIKPTFIEKIAELLFPEKNRVLAYSAYSFCIVVIAVSVFLFVNNEDKNLKENNIVKNSGTNIPEALDGKFKKNQNDNIQNQTAAVGNKNVTISNEDKKFKKCGFTVETGSLASASDDADFQINLTSDLKVDYNAVASIIINRDSKFKFRESGIDLCDGSLDVDIFVKNIIKFSVSTPEALVVVTGTRFSVSRKNNLTEVSVQSGSVKVTDKITGAIETLKHNDKKMIKKLLKQKSNLTAVTTSEIKIESLNNQTLSVELGSMKTDSVTLAPGTHEVKSDTKVNNLINKLKTNNMNEGN